MKKSLEQLGQYFLLMKIVFTRPDKGRIFRKQFFIDTEKLVLNSIPIIAVISIFIGAVIVIQTAYNIESP
ncbi:MAG: ABC transporter permease, partial [Bacteroidales bacterium]|nr:ABC transporter permease [Bacteroidales bacterium]